MVATKGLKYPDRELYDWVINELNRRNINRKTIGEIAYKMQHQYFPKLTVDDFGKELDEVLKKREVLNILATGFALDNLTREGLLPEPLQTIVANDLGVYGVDESLSLSLSQLFGSIAVTNYGYVDKDKPGIARELDNSKGQVNTFADDLALALASAVIGRCGHGSKLNLDDEDIDVDETVDDKVTNEPDSIPTEEEFINELHQISLNSLSDELEEAFTHDYYVSVTLTLEDIFRISFANNAFEHEYGRKISLHDLYIFIREFLRDDLFGNLWQSALENNDLESWIAQYIAAYMRTKDMYIDPEDKEYDELVEHFSDNPSVFAACLAQFLSKVLGDRKEDQHE